MLSQALKQVLFCHLSTYVCNVILISTPSLSVHGVCHCHAHVMWWTGVCCAEAGHTDLWVVSIKTLIIWALSRSSSTLCLLIALQTCFRSCLLLEIRRSGSSRAALTGWGRSCDEVVCDNVQFNSYSRLSYTCQNREPLSGQLGVILISINHY